MKFEEIKKSVSPFLSNKKYQWALTVLVLVIVLMSTSGIRMSNWDLLNDSTTGEKIPLALDPFYFLRVAETIVANDGYLPEFDIMRTPGFDAQWSGEILPNVVVMLWKVANLFGDYTLREINVFSPVFFYVIGMILFFGLIYFLTRSKLASLLGVSFLSVIPSYLYRTMAGFSDHEAIGMVGFFAALVGYVVCLKNLDKLKSFDYKRALLFGFIVALLSVFSIFCWAGVAVLLFMIFPIAFGFSWVIRTRDKKNFFKDNGLVFYLSWIVFSVILAVLFGFGSVGDFVDRYLISSNGIFSLAVLGLIIIDRLFMEYGNKISFFVEKYRIFYSIGSLAVLGGIALPVLGQNIFSLVWTILNKMLNPAWGLDRVSGTVAENAQPYLVDWINTSGVQLFWIFVAGMILVAFNFSRNISSFKNRMFLLFGSIAMIFGILFSRISSTSILNGSGIFSLSGLIYLGGVALFVWAFFKNYLERKLDISSRDTFLFAWMVVILIVGRSTTRLFFVIAPFMCLCAGYFISEMIEVLRKKKLGDLSKVLVIGILVVSILAGGYALYVSYVGISYQAQYTGPSANDQWQKAMSWVRNNTDQGALFAHWWDYGYWVQTLGERATVADGGHAQVIYDGNHKIGRYVLTTPNPDTALSFFKTMDVDYLLIDQTDLGKYGAYSLIGGGNDKEGKSSDRYAGIPIMPNDASQTYETSNGTVVVFSGGSYLYEDVVWTKNGKDVLLPMGKAVLAGIVMKIENNNMIQPELVYYYNNVQTRIPARYVYYEGELVDFGTGLDVVVDIIPAVQNGKLVRFGAAIYLSQKVSDGLFARLYLLDNAFGDYDSLTLSHSEDDPYVEMLKSQGFLSGDFVYYNGFRGPIKIWDVSEIPSEIKVVEEFKAPSPGYYGSLDDLSFSN